MFATILLDCFGLFDAEFISIKTTDNITNIIGEALQTINYEFIKNLNP